MSVAKSVRSIDDKLVEFRSDSFARTSSFFIKNGEVEDKKANIRIVKLQPGGSEVFLLDYEINLSQHFGDKYLIADIDLPTVDPAKKNED